ncbi:dienelactone hydrolase [Novosphingobium chloroacetimidivorans]|uniref:Dienelactone hydrolase n=1 Tax=Novosphingobium chloroacetimidivorans TaxID=1428314 RepID=A0A7W7NV53_9SPHN|nr:dienelactone hydrolase family protein [Novosphingobium chloroacetimidivorans]MBB4856732.1 dienelactone hydrolase [Novosphingobium chloroacetimidivorans]
MSQLEAVAYHHGDAELTGWLARPQESPRAAILVFPTIANFTPAIERRAAMLADLGYLALIADFYGERVADFAAAGPLADKLRADVGHYRARLGAALDALRGLPEAAGLPVFAIGFCMGGQAALELAREGHNLAAAVSFHGILSTDRPAELGRVRARLLVCHGDADPLVPRQQVLGFWEEMDRAGADWHFHVYANVKHGFTDPGSDARGLPAIGYDTSADRQSWTAMRNLFDEILG